MHRNVYFWQNIPSPHQAPLIRAFSRIWPGTVSVILDADIGETRRQSGWTLPDYGRAQVFVAPDTSTRLEIEDLVKHEDINIFSGLGAYTGVTSSMKRLVHKDSTTVLFSESWRMNGLAGFLRSLKYKFFVLRWRDNVSLVLTTGEKAMAQFITAGFPVSALAPFAYFVDGPSGPPSGSFARDDVPQFIFVGNLISLKRVELLLRAFSGLTQTMWRLDIVGAGPLDDSLKQLARHLNISERITWHGAMENAQAHDMIMKADVLVLPSVYDGWGAVIGEALLRGTPVVVSGASGSSELVTEASMGIVVKADSLGELQAALECMILKGPQRLGDRTHLAAECDRRLSATTGANYLVMLLSSLDGVEPRPRAPWKDVSATSTRPGDACKGH